jgi:drug/metabolite transporter (DMT)-like permease
MNLTKLVGVALLAIGIVALAYRGFTYTKATREAKVGPFQVTLKDRERLEIPVWLGVGLAIAGGALLAWGGGQRRETEDR